MTEKEILKKSRWKNLRSRILRRDKYLCQYYLKFGKNIEASHVHHIFPVEIYPEYAYCEWNLISLSQRAHNMMHVRGSHELTSEGMKLMMKTEAKRQEYEAKRQARPVEGDE